MGSIAKNPSFQAYTVEESHRKVCFAAEHDNG